jgi:hypothetical protein
LTRRDFCWIPIRDERLAEMLALKTGLWVEHHPLACHQFLERMLREQESTAQFGIEKGTD